MRRGQRNPFEIDETTPTRLPGSPRSTLPVDREYHAGSPRGGPLRSARTRVLSSSCNSFLSSARRFASASLVACATSSSASLRPKPFFLAEALYLSAELRPKLVVVAGDKGTPESASRRVRGHESRPEGRGRGQGRRRQLPGRRRLGRVLVSARPVLVARRRGRSRTPDRPRPRQGAVAPNASPERARRKARTESAPTWRWSQVLDSTRS